MFPTTSENKLPDISHKPSVGLPWWQAAFSRLRPDSNRLAHRQVSETRPRSMPSPVVLDYRLTVRTQMALAAVGGRPGLNNIEVSAIIGLSDQAQISRMMKRLQLKGLIENSQRHTNRHVKAWRLTTDGEAVINAHRGGGALLQAQRTASKDLKLATRRGAAGDLHSSRSTAATATPSIPFRVTPLTYEVLTAIADLTHADSHPSNREIALATGGRDEGHISKLLRGLEEHGLLQNTGPVTAGAPKAWHLTRRAEDLISTSSPARARVGQSRSTNFSP